MEFILFLTLDGVKIDSFGPHVKNIYTDPRVIHCQLNGEWEDAALFCNDLNEINSECDTLLDYGDVQWFDAGKCAKLAKWIDKRFKKPVDSRYRKLLNVLKSYCSKAVELNTGVIIDL